MSINGVGNGNSIIGDVKNEKQVINKATTFLKNKGFLSENAELVKNGRTTQKGYEALNKYIKSDTKNAGVENFMKLRQSADDVFIKDHIKNGGTIIEAVIPGNQNGVIGDTLDEKDVIIGAEKYLKDKGFLSEKEELMRDQQSTSSKGYDALDKYIQSGKKDRGVERFIKFRKAARDVQLDDLIKNKQSYIKAAIPGNQNDVMGDNLAEKDVIMGAEDFLHDKGMLPRDSKLVNGEGKMTKEGYKAYKKYIDGDKKSRDMEDFMKLKESAITSMVQETLTLVNYAILDVFD